MSEQEDLLTRLRAAAVLAAKETIAAHILPSGMTVEEVLGNDVRELAIEAADAVLAALDPIVAAELAERDTHTRIAMEMTERLIDSGVEPVDTYGRAQQ